MRGRSSSEEVVKGKVSGRNVTDLNDEFGLNAYRGESKDGRITDSPFYVNNNPTDSNRRISMVPNQENQRRNSMSLDKPPDRSSNSNNISSVRSITSSNKEYTLEKPLEWPRVGQSIDVVLQIVVTSTYVICITIFIVQALEQYH